MVRYSKQDVLNEKERMDLIRACKNEKEELIIKGLMFTGMRAGEFAHLKESWIDWQKEIVRVPKKESCGKSCCTSTNGVWSPKTDSGSREIPLMFEAKQVLYNHFEKNKSIDMSRVTLFRRVKSVGKRLRPFKKVYPHSLRATFASMMADKGMGASDIQTIMGWSKLETANNYVKSTQATKNFREKMKS